MVVALACYGAARYIPPTGVGAPGLKVHENVLASTWRVIAELRADDRQWVAALGTSWFWTVGAITLSLVPVIIKSRIGGGIDVEIAINLFFAVGIAAGSLGAAILSRGRIELAPAPFLLLILAALAIDMGLRPGDGDREPRGPARRILHQRVRPAHRARNLPLFRRGGPLCRAALRRGAGLGGRGPARPRRRRRQCAELHLHGRRVARDHDPAAGPRA